MTSQLQSSYTSLFGPIDHARGNESRSVLSPAAYLVDLLELRDSIVSGFTDYHQRRPDVRRIRLDQASTFDEIPFLGVANAVMAAALKQLVGGTDDVDAIVDRTLRTSLFPPPLPFSEQHARLALYADKLGTSLDEIERLYRTGVDAHRSARLRLGLSQEEFDLFATAHDASDEIRALWGVDDPAALGGADVELIKRKLGLSLAELKQLVRQDLSATELAEPRDPAHLRPNAAEAFFINQGPNYIVLDEAPPRLRLRDGSPLTLRHLDRMMRLVRLARRLELSLTDLDWLLQTACGNTLDADGLQAIALALEIRRTTELPIDEICSLWHVAKDHGRGDGTVPADLFDRIYNNDFAITLEAFVASLPGTATADALDDRLQATLRLPGADFAFLEAALLARGVARPALSYPAVVAWFSALRRITTLATMLSLRVQEVVMILDVLGAQWPVSVHDDVAIPLPFSSGALPLSPLGLVIQPDAPPRRTLDVLQKMFRIRDWLELRQLSARQLAYICLEDHADARQRLDDGAPIDDVQPDAAIAAALDDLYQSLRDAMLVPSALQTGSLTPDGARAVFGALREARVVVTFDDPGRGLVRSQPTGDELGEAMRRGLRERLEVHPGDLAALGITDQDAAFSLLVSHGYVERIEQEIDGEREVHHFVPPGLAGYLSSSTGAATFTLPNLQDRAALVFAVLAERVDAARIEPAAIAGAGIDATDVPALFTLLQGRGHVELVPGASPAAYRVAGAARAFFADPANLASFVLPDFTVVFAVLAGKMDAFLRARGNLATEASELASRLAAISDRQIRGWLRSLAGLIGVAEDVTELLFGWAFGTPDETATETFATLIVPLFRARQEGRPALEDAYLASRFRRLSQVALLVRKTAMTADQVRVFLVNQQVHRRLPETVKLPEGFLSAGRIDAFTRLPGGDLLIVSGPKHAVFSQHDDRLLGTGALDQLPGVDLPDAFRARVLADGLDTAFSDSTAEGDPVLHLVAGDQYVTVSGAGTSAPRSIADWGRVRNQIQDRARVDAAVQAADGRLIVFSGDQYVVYSTPEQLLAGPAFVDERYPRSIRGKFPAEGISPLPALMSSGVDAAFRDADDTYFFFAGNRFSHSTDPFRLVRIRPVWGHVLNYLFEDGRVDAAFVFANVTYLTRRDQLVRYTGAPYQFVDEGFPISFGNLAQSEPRLRVLGRFPGGLDAALAGRDGVLYAFKDGVYASSAAPDTPRVIRDHWGRVRNVFIDNQRVDAALTWRGAVYLFSGDQYVRYSGPSYEFVDEGYPRRVRPNWNALEQVGVIPDGLPLPITAVAVGRTATGTSDDVYFFGGSQYAGPDGVVADIKARWARVRNNIERTGVVDAAMVDGSGRMYLFSGDQYYRYGSPEQAFVDETYPRRLAGNWAQEVAGFSLPDSFAGGISAALRAGDGRLWFFSGQSYARVDTSPAPPRAIAQDWGVVRNVIQSQGEVDCAFVDPAGKTYVLSGDQFVRYTGNAFDRVDEGFPLKISTRWPSLPSGFRSDIDAALVFRSPVDNVQRLYLFKGNSYARFSTGDFTQLDAGYPKSNLEGIRAEGLWFRGFAFHDIIPFPHPDDPIDAVEAIYVDTVNGQPRITVFYRHDGGAQWRRQFRNGDWGLPVRVETLAEYQPFSRLDAAFVAGDGTLYAFSGNQYASRPAAGGPLTPPAAIQSRWGKVTNQFADLGRVDACLALPDGRTYLFCATQFIRYTGALQPGSPGFFVDEGFPLRIEPSWPGQGVSIALDPAFQPAGYALSRDAAGKIHFFHGTKYTVSGTAGDAVVSGRWGKVENRFAALDRVDGAYRAENGKLYLFCDSQYTRYSAALAPGDPEFYADEGYPRRVTTGWVSEGLGLAVPDTWSALGSAIFRDGQKTYVFSGSSFTSSQSPAPTPVIPAWANVKNQIQAQNRVDAGFVFGAGPSAVTLVFSGDQYVRYSAGYDDFVDEGYPKVIANLAAADGVFPDLPPALASGVRGMFAGTDGNLHAFTRQPADASEPQLYVSSASPRALHLVAARWGIVDNKLWDNEFVNAALRIDGKLFLFSGDQYLRYSGADRSHVDEGYPRRIASSYAQEIGAAALAPVLDQGVDAALTIGGTGFYFAQDRYVATEDPATDHPLVSRWGRVNNQLQASQRLDAAFVAPNGKLYLFARDQVAVYSGVSRQFVDEEFPRTLATDLGARWPHDSGGEFRRDLDAAASFEGRSYLFKGGQHVRISDVRLSRPDAGYPLGTDGKFVDRFDFELGTLPDWWRIRELFDSFSSQTTTIVDYLDAPPGDLVQGLARATRWPADEIAALLAILVRAPAALGDARTQVLLARCFELAERLGTTPSRLKTQIWDPVFGAGPRSLAPAADVLYGLIKVATSARDWPGVARALRDPIDSVKRDALVAYLVDRLVKPGAGGPEHLRDADELYEYLLTDIQMDASSTTSQIVEAINSIQLYYHRALVHLEDVQSDAVKQNLRAWWPWMKNFRIWEANRKVFLHPENYIRPELRPVKSPAFEALEQKLLQDEITPAAVEDAYQRYVEAFHEISQLRIVGGYRYTATDDAGADRTAVFMVGVSRTEPPVYYSRFGTVADDDRIAWQPWQKVGVTIDSDRVQPVFAFNRLFLFWIETQPFNAAAFSTAGTYSSQSDDVKRVKLTLKFSFYNFNKEWVAPQAVPLNPDDPADPEVLPTIFSADAAREVVLTARNPAPAGNSDQDFIFLTFRFLFWEWTIGRLSAGLDLDRPAPAERFWRFTGLRLLSDPAAQFPAQIGIPLQDISAIVPWGAHLASDAGAWFSFDAKGGTFLCRPVDVVAQVPGTILGKPFVSVSAAFATSAGDVFVFTTEARGGVATPCFHHYVHADRSWHGPVFVGDPAWPWGRPAGVFQQFPDKRIRNVIVASDGKTYFLLDAEYFSYAPGNYDAMAEHYATELPHGAPALDQLIGSGVPAVSWQDAVGAGKTPVQSFKQPGTDLAVLVSSDGTTPGVVSASVADLRQASADKDGHSPFDGWDGLDTVFLVTAPELRVVFSRGTQLVIFTWSSRTWTTAALGALPGGAPGLSAAFSGVDGKLYYLCADRYAEVDPVNLDGNHLFVPVDARWGRPSLFSWLLRAGDRPLAIDGGLFGPDGKLYLFAGEYCLRYSGFDPAGLDRLVLDDRTADPPKVAQVWQSPTSEKPSVERVTAAFARNGRVYLFGQRLSDGKPFAARYSQGTQSPFAPDPGYPMLLTEGAASLSTDFYAGLLLGEQHYSITRLTSHTSEQFSRRLFAGGIPRLLSLQTQEVPEIPRFAARAGGGPGRPDELIVDPVFVTEYPGQGSPGGLDFASTNAFYYREIFFHIPFLIAQAFKQEQRFDDAERWYEYVFDPTDQDGNGQFWRYIEFLHDGALTPLHDQIDAYRDDPFDPHKIAELRPIAYHKAFVMSYIDNLMAWGDMLFRQFTRETIGEATMLYVRAAHLLGKRPEDLGKRVMELPDSLTYQDIRDRTITVVNDDILELENGVPPASGQGAPPAIPNDSIFNPYFYIPENDQFIELWSRVGDRLFKIRHGLNIDGVKQALALFAPPVDVLALVKAFASGAGVAQVLADESAAVPHYRFAYMLGRARELTGRLIGLGSSLLSALEKKDAEQLSVLRNTQERAILDMQLRVKEQQLESARQSLAALEEGLRNAQLRESHYQQLLSVGLTAHEQEQVAQMIAGQVFSQIANVFGTASSIGYAIPQVGSPFAMTYGGIQLGSIVNGLSGAFKALSEMSSFQSSLAATLGGWERRSQDWELQKNLATGDTLQIGRQIKAAQVQVDIASQEIQIHRKQIKNNEAIDTFMNGKFTSQQLYQFMAGKLSAVYFQTYHLALQYAKAAQRALQFELALPESDVQVIGAAYWDSLKKGLTAGEQLQLDLDRLEKAHCDANERRMEITKYVSLAEVDPLALVRLKEQGSCEFELGEALFDDDFPGHYCRQIRTVSLSFPAVVGPYHNFNATLTQLGHRTLLLPDKAALRYLLGASQPASQPAASVLRVDWRPNQQVALSTGANDSGLFQVDYHDERYLPFEGTGAVSSWRLEINGVDGPLHRQTLSDVIMTVRYTARVGGAGFAQTVKSAVAGKPRDRAWLLSLADDFPDRWQAFMNKPLDGMVFTVERKRLPAASDRRVTGVYLHYALVDDPVDDLSHQQLTLNGVLLKPGSFKGGLALPLLEQGQNPAQVTWTLVPAGGASKFSARNLRSIALVVTYTSKSTF